jgi:hypothetical protein
MAMLLVRAAVASAVGVAVVVLVLGAAMPSIRWCLLPAIILLTFGAMEMAMQL